MILQSGLGIDINDRYIAVVYLKATFKNIKTEAHAVFTFHGDQPLKDKLEIATDFINEFIRTQNITSADIFLGIPRDLAIIKGIEFPLAVKENLRSTLTYEMEKYIPIPVDDVYFDYQVLTEDKALNRLKLLLTVVKKSTLEPYLDLIRKSGIGVSGLEISSTALVNLFFHLRKTSADDDRAFAYIHGNGFQIDRVQSNKLIASKSVKNAGDSDNLYSQLKEELNALGVKEHSPALICGPGLDAHLADRVKDDSTVAMEVVPPEQYAVPSHDLLVAAGLAMKGVHEVPMQVNLLPFLMRKKPSKAGLYIMMVLAILVVLFGLTWGGSCYMRQRMTVDTLNAEIQRLSKEVSEIDRIQAESDAIRKQVDYLVQVQHDSVNILDILKELSLRIPESAWVRDFSLNEKGIRIEGFAASASELIPLIEGSPFFCDVAFLAAITKDRDGKERFKIGFNLSSRVNN